MKIINQITVSELWKETMQRVEQDPQWAEHKGILDYELGEKSNELLVNHRFDIVAETAFGGSEGIYSTVYLEGEFFTYQKGPRFRIGTLKTLNCKKEDYLAMAVLSNLISYHMGEYVNEHINRFEDDERAAIYFQCEGAYGNVTLRSIMDESPALVCYGKSAPLAPLQTVMPRLLEKAINGYGRYMHDKARDVFVRLAEKYGAEIPNEGM